MRTDRAFVVALLIGAAMISVSPGCTSVSIDDLTLREGVFYDAAGSPYTGTALCTIGGLTKAGFGAPPTATVPYKLRFRDGHAVAVKYSSAPLAPWAKLPAGPTGTTEDHQ